MSKVELARNSLCGAYQAVAAAFLVSALAGCGVESGSSGSTAPAGGLSQHYQATIQDASGTPLSDVLVALVHSGEHCMTNSSGTCQIDTTNITGDISIGVERQDWGTGVIMLPDVPAEAVEVSYSIQMTSTPGTAILESLAFDGVSTISPPSDGTDTPLPGTGSDDGAVAQPTPTPDPGADLIAQGKKVFRSICGACHAIGQGDGLSRSQLIAKMTLTQHEAVSVKGSNLDKLVAFLNR